MVWRWRLRTTSAVLAIAVAASAPLATSAACMAADAAISAEACEAICARTGCPMHKGMMTAGKPASPKGPIQCVLDSGVGGHHAMLVLGHTLSTMPAAIFHSLPRDASEPLARLDARRPDVALQTAVPPPRSV